MSRQDPVVHDVVERLTADGHEVVGLDCFTEISAISAPRVGAARSCAAPLPGSPSLISTR